MKRWTRLELNRSIEAEYSSSTSEIQAPWFAKKRGTHVFIEAQAQRWSWWTSKDNEEQDRRARAHFNSRFRSRVCFTRVKTWNARIHWSTGPAMVMVDKEVLYGSSPAMFAPVSCHLWGEKTTPPISLNLNFLQMLQTKVHVYDKRMVEFRNHILWHREISIRDGMDLHGNAIEREVQAPVLSKNMERPYWSTGPAVVARTHFNSRFSSHLCFAQVVPRLFPSDFLKNLENAGLVALNLTFYQAPVIDLFANLMTSVPIYIAGVVLVALLLPFESLGKASLWCFERTVPSSMS